MNMIVLFVSDVGMIVRFLMTALKLSATGNHTNTNVNIDHVVINTPKQDNILIIKKQDEEPSKQQHVILETDDITLAVSAALAMGIDISEEFTIPNTGNICKINNIDSVEFVFIEPFTNDETSVVSVEEVYLQWITSSALHNSEAVVNTNVQDNHIPKWKPPPGTFLPKIRSLLLHKGTYESIMANPESPIPFTSDLFEGQFMLLVNSDHEQKEAFLQQFQEGKYSFEVQVQGRFKEIPPGPIFIGAEITKKMELGMLTRGVCGSILQLGRATNAYMHHSFGDANNYELPHITGPFWSSVDRLVITKPGDEPPPFIQYFPEDLKQRAARKSNADFHVDLDLNSTYSFSFKTTKLDLEEWAVVNIPFMRSMALGTFWADADLRLVAYCVPNGIPDLEYSSSNGLPKRHPQKYLKQFFSLEVQHDSNHPDWGEIGEMEIAQNENIRSMSRVAEQLYESIEVPSDFQLLKRSESMGNIDDEDDKDDYDSMDEDAFHDARDGYDESGEVDVEVEGPSLSEDAPSVYSASLSASEVEVASNSGRDRGDTTGTLDDKNDEDLEDMVAVKSFFNDKMAQLNDHIQTARLSATMLKRSLVIAAVEVDDAEKRQRRVLYAFLMNHSKTSHNATNRQYVLHSYGEWKQALPMRRNRYTTAPHIARMSEEGKRRIQLTHAYDGVLRSSSTLPIRNVLETFLADDRHNTAFLLPSTRGVGAKKLRVNLPDFMRESMVCVQQGNFIWSQECIGLTEEELIFIKPSKLLGTSVRQRILLSDILDVRTISEVDNPLPIADCQCFMVATFAKQYTVLIRGSSHRDSWVHAIQSKLSRMSSEYTTATATNAPPLPAAAAAGVVVDREQRSRPGSHGGAGGLYTASTSSSGGGQLQEKRSSGSFTKVQRRESSNHLFPAIMATTSSASALSGMVTYPPDWNLGDKMILNCRNFTANGALHQLSTRTLQLGRLTRDPCQLVAKLLDMAFKLSHEINFDDITSSRFGSLNNGGFTGTASAAGSSTDKPAAGRSGEDAEQESSIHSINNSTNSVEELWVDFMDGVSLLHGIDLSNMDKKSPEAACLFMNLYHCMLLHAYMVVGLPNSVFKWSNFFRNCSYEAFGDIFSLAEVEHCILRHGMKRPELNFLAQMLIPNVEYSFGLEIRDYRLLWGIFCGATSNVTSIPIYVPEKLNLQLEYVIRGALENELKVKESTSSIVLPIVCQLYMKEFDPNPLGPGSFTSRDLLRVLLKHLQGELKTAVKSLVDKKGSFSVKYSPLDFNCKYPVKLRDEEILQAMS